MPFPAFLLPFPFFSRPRSLSSVSLLTPRCPHPARRGALGAGGRKLWTLRVLYGVGWRRLGERCTSPSVCPSPPSLPPSLALSQISGLTSRPLIRLFPASPSPVANRREPYRRGLPPPRIPRAGRGAAGAGPALQSLPAPSGLRPEAPGRGARGRGVSTGSARPCPLPAPRHLSPCPSAEPGSGPDLGPGQAPGPWRAGAPFGARTPDAWPLPAAWGGR